MHAVRCGAEGDLTRRHNQLRNYLFNECKAALMAPVLEPPNLLRNDKKMRPADIGIPDYRPGQFMCYDVAITDPTQTATVPNASVIAGSAAESYAKKKIAKYSDSLPTDGSILFTPIICETYGAWNDAAFPFFNELSTWLASRSPNSSFRVIRSRLFQKVSELLSSERTLN
jgi:hypothetical protein